MGVPKLTIHPEVYLSRADTGMIVTAMSDFAKEFDRRELDGWLPLEVITCRKANVYKLVRRAGGEPDRDDFSAEFTLAFANGSRYSSIDSSVHMLGIPPQNPASCHWGCDDLRYSIRGDSTLSIPEAVQFGLRAALYIAAADPVLVMRQALLKAGTGLDKAREWFHPGEGAATLFQPLGTTEIEEFVERGGVEPK